MIPFWEVSMNILRNTLLAGVAVAAIASAGKADAGLIAFQQYTGNVAVSTDGFGSTTNAGNISAFVLAGSTVVNAYLYSSTFSGPQPGGTLGGQPVIYSTALGTPGAGLEAFRADVTSIVAPTINGGPGGTYVFPITEIGGGVDGGALVVVYTNPTLPSATVGILDGFSLLTGDSTILNFASPLNPAAAGFFAELRLGIGFSCCSQASEVKVNNQLVTSNAGNNDDSIDGIPLNGNLITVGGSNDPFSPLLPSYAADTERYNLIPYITLGDTSITINTVNPSNDDNIFLAVIYASGIGGVNQPPPVTTVPEPTSLALFGVGMLGLGIARRWRKVARKQS